jgi:hypothetical protein
MPSEAAVPSIKLFVGSGFDSGGIARELLCGAEEEGVPCEIEAAGEEGAAALAYRAAQESVLGVGLGLDRTGMAAAHYNKLPADKPLFTLNYRLDRGKLRGLAANAARLVKGMPFAL